MKVANEVMDINKWILMHTKKNLILIKDFLRFYITSIIFSISSIVSIIVVQLTIQLIYCIS